MLSKSICFQQDKKCAFGFTLVELLVVMAIISILLTLLIPGVSHMIGKAQQVRCAANMKRIYNGWVSYADDHNGRLVGAKTREAGDWVISGPWDKQRKQQGIRDGALWPYVNSLEAYRCPTAHGFLEEYIRHYSLSGNFNGEGSRWKLIHEVPDPSGTLLMIEDYDWREYLMNSWYIQRGSWYQWVDYVPGNHMQGDNVLFADGHVEYRRWEDPDTLGVYSVRRFHLHDPDGVNPDLDWLGRAFKAAKFYKRNGKLINPDKPPFPTP